MRCWAVLALEHDSSGRRVYGRGFHVARFVNPGLARGGVVAYFVASVKAAPGDGVPACIAGNHCLDHGLTFQDWDYFTGACLYSLSACSVGAKTNNKIAVYTGAPCVPIAAVFAR